ncbi:trypsin-like peptidase domain-containing protein [Actinomadura rifamycini]|uniref:trypsin-like peptidase domain-containing protein n=1 Tax=Actinomadura rifamycini TaxID=31962 RepID=UPI00040F135F|nr:trypsin-like peptidase domain-containing protein [Actinomadura rifamycini]
MTEDNRGPFRASTEDDDAVPAGDPGRQEAAAPPETVTDQEFPAGPGDDASGAAAGAAAAGRRGEEPGDDAEPFGADPAERPDPAGASDGDRLVAGGAQSGFAPPDGPFGETAEDIPAQDAGVPGPQEVPLQEGSAQNVPPPPSLEKHAPPDQPPPAPLDPPPAPDGPDGRPRPGFVPYDQAPPSPGGMYGPGGWASQQHGQPGPPPGGPAGGPPPAPMGPPPGGPQAAGFGGPPNWAPVPAPPPSSRTGPGLGLLAVIALIVALVAGAVGAGVGVIATDGDDGAVSLGGGSGSSSGGAAPNRPPDSVAGVASRVLPSVVMIRVQSAQGEVGGTGFIVEGGYIITNNHVVSGGGSGGRIEVVFNDKKTLPATIKGTDPGTDIAVIKPEGDHELKALQLGDSAALAVGDPVIAIGSPLGLQGSVTTGIVSSLNRAVPIGDEGGGESSYLNAIQTDAAINPGNSGGPLVDMKGRVIGINTAIATVGGQTMGGEQQGGNIGLGFAIPINQGKRIAEEIIANGRVRQALLGVLPDPRYQQGGARILPEPVQGQQPVTPNGPADKAGIKPGDVITKVDGRPIQDATDLIAQIRSRAPGDQVKVTYERDGRESTVTVTLAASS